MKDIIPASSIVCGGKKAHYEGHGHGQCLDHPEQSMEDSTKDSPIDTHLLLIKDFRCRLAREQSINRRMAKDDPFACMILRFMEWFSDRPFGNLVSRQFSRVRSTPAWTSNRFLSRSQAKLRMKAQVRNSALYCLRIRNTIYRASSGRPNRGVDGRITTISSVVVITLFWIVQPRLKTCTRDSRKGEPLRDGLRSRTISIDRCIFSIYRPKDQLSFPSHSVMSSSQHLCFSVNISDYKSMLTLFQTFFLLSLEKLLC